MKRNAAAAPAASQSAAESGATSSPAQPVQNRAAAVKVEHQKPAVGSATFQPAQAWPPSAGGQRPAQQEPAAAAAAAAYSAALNQQSRGVRGATMHRQPAVPQYAQQMPRPCNFARRKSGPTEIVDLDSSSDGTSSGPPGVAAQDASAQDTVQRKQDAEAGDEHNANGTATSLLGKSLGAHRRVPPAAGSIFRPVPIASRYHRRQPPPGSQATSGAAPAAAGSAEPVPEATAAPAPSRLVTLETPERPDAECAAIRPFNPCMALQRSSTPQVGHMTLLNEYCGQ